MKRSLLVLGATLAALTLVGLAAGDPRAGSDLGRADLIFVWGLLIAIGAAVLAWRTGRARSFPWLVPIVVLAIVGGLSGWIAGAEFTLEPDVPVRLGARPLRAAFMVGLTALGMALPALGVSALAGWLTPRGRART